MVTSDDWALVQETVMDEIVPVYDYNEDVFIADLCADELEWRKEYRATTWTCPIKYDEESANCKAAPSLDLFYGDRTKYAICWPLILIVENPDRWANYEINENGYAKFIDRVTHKEAGTPIRIDIYSFDAKATKIYLSSIVFSTPNIVDYGMLRSDDFKEFII